MKANMKSGARTAITHLSQMAQTVLAPWPTPQARDCKGARTGEELYSHNTRPLNEQVVMLLGETSTGSPAPTGERDQLDPAFSLWLMGYRPAWTSCAPPATPSSRTSPPRS